MKREPRLQFSDADLAEPKLKKPIKRVKKAEAKADKAQAKIPKKTVVKKERGFDPATGKVKTQLRFEEVDKKKPPSKLTHAVQDAPANLILSQVHREVRQSEDDNVGVEAAHKMEQTVESGGRLVQSAHRAHQLKPYRAAIRAEKKLERANLDALQKKAEIDSPTSNPVSKWQQKQAIKKQYAAAKHNQAAQTTAKAAENTAKAAKKAGEDNAAAMALQIDDEPCAVMLSATGLIARTSEDALERWENRSSADQRVKDDQIISIFRTTTRSSYGLITSAGRLIVAHVVELPVVSADGPLHVTGGVHAEELIGTTENTDPIRGERVIAAIAMPSADDSGDNAVEPTPLALGTRNGVVKRWNRESPTTMDSWSVIDLKDDDEVLAAAEARDEDRLVFVSTDSSLLTFEAKNVRPQGRTAGGMAGIRLAEGCSAAAFAVVPASKVAWNYEEGENGLFSASGAVVLTVAGDSEALPGTENGSAKVTPLEMYPTKGRGTGGVRSQRFLKGQDTLVLAFVGAYPVHASTQGGAGVELPKPDMRRDGSGTELSAPIAIIG